MPLGDKLPQRQRISFFPSVASKKLGLSERGWLLSYTRRAVDTGNIKAEIQMRVNDLQKRESRSSHKKVESDMQTAVTPFY